MKNKTTTPNRAGLSLMEVLAAIFVLSFGLLGVLSVVPYGMYQVERAGIANHGGNCLRGIEQEISIREWNTPKLFDILNPTPMSMSVGNFITGTPAVVHCEMPIIVDPLFETRLNNATPSPFDNTDPPPHSTLAFALHATFTPPLTKEQSQNIFLWQEDVDFNKVPDGGSDFFTKETTSGTITPPSAGKYSWFFVVNIQPSKDPIYTDPANYDVADEPNHIFASKIGTTTNVETRVAVCYNRSPGDTLCEGNFAVDTTSITPTSTGGMITLTGLPDEFDTSDTRYMLLISRRTSDASARYLPHWYKIIYRNENQFMITGERALDDTGILEYRVVLIRGLIFVSDRDTIPGLAN
ncbi:MAG: hypothetical protein LBU65_08375 [Planctomycetaceae bacterium]|jgi:hypothetical protein|nr:hypothetical protein [Planctomycetaceae bacterium]